MLTASTAGFTPMVATLHAEVEAAARALLGIPPAVALRWDTREIGRMRIALRSVSGRDLVVEIRDPAGPHDARWRLPGEWMPGLGYQRLADGTDPWRDPELRPFLEAMARHFMRSAPEARALRAAIARCSRFSGLADHVFRQVNAGSDDAVGNLRLGFRCNQNCGMCWQGRHWPDPDAPMLRTWLDEMAAMGVKTLAISGGEPTLHPDLPALLAHAEHTLGLEVTLQTNAVQFAKRRVLEPLLEAGLQRVFVSLHSMDKRISDAMTRAPGTWKRTIAGLEALLDAGVAVGLNCVVERRNHDSLRTYAEAVVARFFTGRPRARRLRDLSFSHPCSSFSPAWYADQTVALDAVAPRLGAALAVLEAAGIRSFALGTFGFVPCVLRAEPALLSRQLERTPAFELADATDTAGRRFLAECDGCRVRDRCPGIRKEYVAIHGGAGLAAVRAAP